MERRARKGNDNIRDEGQQDLKRLGVITAKILETLTKSLGDGPRFYGRGDPVLFCKHFEQIYAASELSNVFDEATMVRIFSMCLREKALNWFFNLPDSEKTTLEGLKQAFITRFSRGGVKRHPYIKLNSLRQRNEEDVRDYIDRMRGLMARCEEPLDDSIALKIFINGLKSAKVERAIRIGNHYTDLPSCCREAVRLEDELEGKSSSSSGSESEYPSPEWTFGRRERKKLETMLENRTEKFVAKLRLELATLDPQQPTYIHRDVIWCSTCGDYHRINECPTVKPTHMYIFCRICKSYGTHDTSMCQYRGQNPVTQPYRRRPTAKFPMPVAQAFTDEYAEGYAEGSSLQRK